MDVAPVFLCQAQVPEGRGWRAGGRETGEGEGEGRGKGAGKREVKGEREGVEGKGGDKHT